MKYEIELKLPSLNEYIRVCRCNKFQAAKFKADIELKIGLYLMKMPKWTNPIKIHFHWIEGNKKRDLDNIAFAKKFILDSMVKYGKLQDDNRKCVTSFTDSFSYSKDGSFKVVLEIEEVKQ
jgi:Holliday junction resolvase RusA-like endonuclease